jgi:hypothetical protein
MAGARNTQAELALELPLKLSDSLSARFNVHSMSTDSEASQFKVYVSRVVTLRTLFAMFTSFISFAYCSTLQESILKMTPGTFFNKAARDAAKKAHAVSSSLCLSSFAL